VSNNTALTRLGCYETLTGLSLGSNEYSIPIPSDFDISKVSGFKVDDVSTIPSVVAGALVFTATSTPHKVDYQYDVDNSTIGSMDVTVNITSVINCGIATGIEEAKSQNSTDLWYTMDGKKLNTKPRAKGVYIKNGQKVVIK
jgi:hypothetical protein